MWDLEKRHRWTYLSGSNRDSDVENGRVIFNKGSPLVWLSGLILYFPLVLLALLGLGPSLGWGLDFSRCPLFQHWFTGRALLSSPLVGPSPWGLTLLVTCATLAPNIQQKAAWRIYLHAATCYWVEGSLAVHRALYNCFLRRARQILKMDSQQGPTSIARGTLLHVM